MVIRRRHTSSSRTTASTRRCRMPSCSRSTRRTMSSGCTSTAKSGRFSTSSLIRASSFTVPITFKVRELPLHGVCSIVNKSNADCTWRYFSEHLSLFCSAAVLPEGEPGYVASRSRWPRDQAGGDRIAHLCEYDRQGAGSVLPRHHGRLIAGENSIRPHPHEFGSEASQALVIPAWPALLDVEVATFDPPEILQATAERRHAELAFGVLLRQPRNQHADAVHLLTLLCAHRERPRRCAAEHSDELAPLHSITSSAMASTVCGTSRPSAFAALRLIANSNLVGCTTGRSAGRAPLSTLPT